MNHTLTWEDLVNKEPTLFFLLKNIQHIQDPGGPSFCALQLWVDQYKDQLFQLVGPDSAAQDLILRSHHALHIAFDKLFYALPHCRDCPSHDPKFLTFSVDWLMACLTPTNPRQPEEELPQSAEGITWEELIAIEPALQEMLTEISHIEDASPSFCANQTWFDQYDERMGWLVGWYATKANPRLRTSDAYDLAFEKLYNALPDCRDCNCVREVMVNGEKQVYLGRVRVF